MFCSEGYITLQELIERFHSDVTFKESSANLVDSMLLDSGICERAEWIVKHHPMRDIIEKIVFEEVFRVGLYVCSPTGQVLSLRMPFHMVDYTTHELIQEMQCFDALKGFDEFFDLSENLADLKSQHDELGYIERKYSSDKKLYIEAMSRNWLRGHSRINLYFHRSSYTVSTFILDCLERTHLMHWSPVGRGLGDVGPVLRQMEGYSLCIKESDEKLLSIEKITHKFGDQIYSHLVGEDRVSTDSDNASAERKGGRPNKSDEAARIVLDYYGSNSVPNFKEAVRFLEEKHDIRVHKRTLQRGLKRIHGDKT